MSLETIGNLSSLRLLDNRVCLLSYFRVSQNKTIFLWVDCKVQRWRMTENFRKEMGTSTFWKFSLATLVLFAIQGLNGEPVWRWECIRGFCQKLRITPETRNSALSLPACRLFCAKHAGLWPQPTGEVKLGNYLIRVNVNSIDVLQTKNEASAAALVRAAARRFQELMRKLSPKSSLKPGGRSLVVTVDIGDPSRTKLTLDTDESYTLNTEETSDGRINVTIAAPTYFGARHGLETLWQLALYDDVRDEIQMARDVRVKDAPIYPYRGILLDTSRNFISVDAIKRTIDAMASTKLNTFHWHITDSHSFPYVSKTHPFLSQVGAYSPSKVYTKEDIADVIQFGKERGVRVMPEFDAPAHVGEGWQDTGFVACFNGQPWQYYCVEPPCGQLDPTQPKLYDLLDGIYKDMVEQFQPDIFHMGGDEVSLSCWNSTESIVQWMAEKKGWSPNEENFVKLWDVFQSEALRRLSKYAGEETPIIMWTSKLTQKDYIEQYLPRSRYIIQVWTTGSDPQIYDLLERDYRLILSNYDALYFDCGFAAWVGEGNNWCSPYIGWQKVYDNSPAKIAGRKKSHILGSEACLWTEQVDDSVLDSRLWPRASAMAERLWAEPEDTWRYAQERMVVHRERLVLRGIAPDAIEPEWCGQNEQNCPQGGEFNSFSDKNV